MLLLWLCLYTATSGGSDWFGAGVRAGDRQVLKAKSSWGQRAGLLALAGALAACGGATAAKTTTSSGAKSTTTASAPPSSSPGTSGGSTGAKVSSGSKPPAAIKVPHGVPMPNRALTPGWTQSDDDTSICTPGWAAAHRGVSVATDDAVAASYGLSSRQGYAIDHLIPVELGGANTKANLWPDPYNSPYGEIEKDGLGLWLHHRVCGGYLLLSTAQHEIAANWYTAWVMAGSPLPSLFGLSNSPPPGSHGAPPPTTIVTAGAWCQVSARPVFSHRPGDYDVSITSNRPDAKATAHDAGGTRSDVTDNTGSVLIRILHTHAGDEVSVVVGGAACTTTARG